ncbi:MAG: long-chain fatty acid--CoA ligase [Phycisphaerae bacterium]|nr:long-chain fatty acid--CoA ligase [Phycisphaerae bacterium]
MNPLLDAFEKVCAERGGALAAGDQAVAFNYQTLRAVAAGLAEQIEARTQQSQVGILAPTSAVGAAAIFACWYAGKVPVPLNFLLSPAEMGRIIRDAELDFILTVPHFQAAAAATGLNHLVLTPESLTPAQATRPVDRSRRDARADDVAAILYTSGTSGDPKGVCLSYENLTRNALACIEHAHIRPDHVWLSPLPQFHTFGFTVLTVTPLLLGSTVWYLPRFSPAALAQIVAEKKVSVLIAIPSMFAAVLNLKSAQREMFQTLEYTISGGEPLPEKVYRGFLERFGVAICEGYGLTETAPVVSMNMPWDNRPGSVGRPIPGVSVTVVDEDGAELPAGQTGELVVRGHGVMLGYYHNPEATAEVLRDGALWTGDMGYLDADGFVHITGRAKEMIIVGGENVFPREIENVLAEHSAVREAAVIGVRDDVRGELPAAFVILKEDAVANETELRDFCRSRLAGYKVPRWVRIAPELPRSATGKILKRALIPPP